MNSSVNKFFPLVLALHFAVGTLAQANESTVAVQANKPAHIDVSIKETTKRKLMTKLSTLNFFSANFSQQVFTESGELIEESTGTLALSKPNLANWQVLTPDELSIVADGDNVWFYNPWIEQVSIYSLSAAIAHTPILLLTSNDEALWQQYTVSEIPAQSGEQPRVQGVVEGKVEESNETFLISANDINSQIKTLTLVFNTQAQGGQLSQFSFLDTTGQLSRITLTAFNDKQAPNPALFSFIAPEGTQVDDQR